MPDEIHDLSRLSCGTQARSEFPKRFFQRDVLRHSFRQDLILGLDLLLQIGDPLLLGGMVGPRFGLEGSRPVLEELVLPAVENRRLECLFVTQLRDRHLRSRSVNKPSTSGTGPFMSSAVAETIRTGADKLLHRFSV